MKKYTIDDITFYSRGSWLPTSRNYMKAVWLGVQCLFAIEVINWARGMTVELLVIALVILWVIYKTNEI